MNGFNLLIPLNIGEPLIGDKSKKIHWLIMGIAILLNNDST